MPNRDKDYGGNTNAEMNYMREQKIKMLTQEAEAAGLEIDRDEDGYPNLYWFEEEKTYGIRTADGTKIKTSADIVAPTEAETDTGFLNTGNPYDEFLQEEEGEDLYGSDPMFEAFRPSVYATEEEENQLIDVTTSALSFVFGKGTPAVVRVVQAAQEPFMGVAEVAFQALLKEKTEMESQGQKPSSSVFLSQEGAIPAVVNGIFEVAQAAGIPGANDPDQFAAAIIEVYRKAGEYITNEGDERAVAEASELIVDSVTGNQETP